jgi:tricorn protease
MRRFLLALALCAAAPLIASAQAETYDLLRQPTLSRTEIAFSYAGDLWIVGRDGGDARRLTASPGLESRPIFSPDGAWIAFTGQYDGNTDVYVMPAAGGVPTRLTWHPNDDVAVGWSPDGARILFRSSRYSYADFNRLFTIPVTGEAGVPDQLPLPVAQEGSFSPDGARIAYVPNLQWQAAWKRYRGGQTTPIWIANLADSSIEKLPRENSNDSQPIWVGDTIYFLSDRNGPVSLFAYDTKTRAVREAVRNTGLDIKSVSAGPGAIAFERFGAIHLYDPATGRDRRISIRVAGDLPEVRPSFRKVEPGSIQTAHLSPTGVRAVFEARGEIMTVPAAKGDVRNLTSSPGVADRDPAWSPDGKRIAYFSDASGEYALHVRDQNGSAAPQRIDLGAPSSYFYGPLWSPDSSKIAFTDKRMSLWYVDVAAGRPIKVDTDRFETPFRAISPAWSPDGKWLAYTKQLSNNLRAVFVHSLAANRSYQVTDGMSDAQTPVFDASGKYLYFTASTDVGLAASWLDMSGINRPVSRGVYVAVLRKDLPSPLAPESDEEKPAPAPPPPAGAVPPAPPAPPAVTIDTEGIGQRILTLPIPQKNYSGLVAGKENVLFLAESAQVPSIFGGGPIKVTKFDLATRKVDPVADNVTFFEVSANGEKMLLRLGETWYIAATATPFKPEEGSLKLADVEVWVDPRAEWRQMYREVWRIERDFFYDPGLHGLDLKATMARYEPYVERLASRNDLNYLFTEMLGEITAGHVFVGGGDLPKVKQVKGGLLGADFAVENGRYRFARVYNGENWNPQLQAPLTQPGVNVAAGEYLLAVRGQELRATDNVFRALEATAGKQVVLRVGPNPDGTGAREVTVVPVDSEQGLRNLAWIEDNRRKVEQMTGGRVAYVHLPNTGGEGYTNFNRYYFAQVGKEAAVVDERFNGGGLLADYIVDLMRRPPLSRIAGREGEDQTSPGAAIYGPKVMLVNEMAGSGGDAMPWYFRKAGVGQIVGTRTWGGLIGIFDYPVLIDGGQVTAPRVAIYGLEGDWEVENRGITPDVVVELDPKLWRQGRDAQLEKAVEVVMEALRKSPVPTFKRPPYPKYQ